MLGKVCFTDRVRLLFRYRQEVLSNTIVERISENISELPKRVSWQPFYSSDRAEHLNTYIISEAVIFVFLELVELFHTLD